MKKLLASLLLFLLPIMASAQQFVPFLKWTSATGTDSTTTTLYISNNASTTNLYGTTINGFSLATCNSAASALTWAAGIFGCHTISAGAGGGSGTWATTTSQTSSYINYPLNNTDIVVVGGTATTSAPLYFDPNISLAKIFNQFFGTSSTTLQNFTFVNATGTNATTTALGITGIKKFLLATDANGTVVATSTIGNNQLQNSAITINGTSISLGGSQTVGAASSTLLGDNNYFNGNDTFSNTVTGSVSGNAGTATKLQNARTINGVSFDGTANITVASTTLLGDNNYFSGNNTFSNTIAGSINGNANTATTLQNARTINGVSFNGSANITVASTTLLGDNNYFSGSDVFSSGVLNLSSTTLQNFTFVNATGTQATTTDLYVSGTASTSNLILATGTGCLQASASGVVSATGSNCGSGGGGGSGGTWSTTTSQVSGELINYPNNNTDIVTVGGTATSSAKVYLDPNSKIYSFLGTASATQVSVGAGTHSAPSIIFSSGDGFYDSSSQIFFKTNGFDVLTIGSGLVGANFEGIPLVSRTSSNGTNALGFWVSGAPGTVAAPVYSFVNDSGTGLWDQGSGIINISSNGSKILAANTASTTIPIGNLAVGSTSPSLSKLTVSLNTDTYNPLALLISSSTPTATTTLFQVDSNGLASTTNLTISGLGNGSTQCLHIDGSGNVTGTNSDCGSGGGGAPYPFQGLNNSTSTTVGFTNGIFSVASSTIGNGTQGGGLTVSGEATTSNLLVTGSSTLQNATTTSLGITGILKSLLATDASGNVVATSTIGNNQLQNSSITINGTSISLGGSQTVGAASSTLLGDNNYFSGADVFSSGVLHLSSTTLQAFTFTNSTGTQATTTDLYVSGLASTSALYLPVPSSLLITSASGKVGAYGGASACSTHNFVTTISASGATTCGTDTISGVSFGSNLFNHSHDTTLTGTTYNGSAAVSDWGIDLTHANTWTGNQMFVASTTIGANTTGTGLTINGGATTTGQFLALGSTTLQNFTFVNATGTQASTTNLYVSGNASTSNLILGTGTGCLQASASGVVSATGSNCGSGGGSYPFPLTNNSTSTLTGFTGGIYSVASSTIGNGTQGGGLTVAGEATTTNLLVTSSTTLQNLTFTTATGTAATTTTFYASSTASIASSTPYASVLSLGAPAGTAPLLAIGSTTSNGGTGLVASVAYTPYAAIAAGTSTPDAEFAFNASTTAAAGWPNAFDIGSSTSGTAYATLFRVSQGGSLFAPNTLTQSGAATDYWCYDASGQFIRVSNTCTVSAAKFKKDVTPLPASQGLAAVLAMHPVNYYLNALGLANSSNPDDTRQQIGFIADDATNTVPLLVLHDSTGAIHGFNYEQYTANLTLAIQQLNAKVEQGKRNVEENWQWAAIVLLALWIIRLEIKLKKHG